MFTVIEMAIAWRADHDGLVIQITMGKMKITVKCRNRASSQENRRPKFAVLGPIANELGLRHYAGKLNVA